MPLIDCIDCGKKISDAADACIHCGRPTRLLSVTSSTKCKKCQQRGLEVLLAHSKRADASNAVGFSSMALIFAGIVLLVGFWPLGIILIVGGILVFSLAKKEVKEGLKCPKCSWWEHPVISADPSPM